jgi:hypothetical protein
MTGLVVSSSFKLLLAQKSAESKTDHSQSLTIRILRPFVYSLAEPREFLELEQLISWQYLQQN